jgi:hypothetical protein
VDVKKNLCQNRDLGHIASAINLSDRQKLKLMQRNETPRIVQAK